MKHQILWQPHQHGWQVNLCECPWVEVSHDSDMTLCPYHGAWATIKRYPPDLRS